MVQIIAFFPWPWKAHICLSAMCIQSMSKWPQCLNISVLLNSPSPKSPLELKANWAGNSCKNLKMLAGYWWLTPIILGTQKAVIRRISVCQPRQIVCETLSQKTHHKKGLVEWLECRPWVQAPAPHTHTHTHTHFKKVTYFQNTMVGWFQKSNRGIEPKDCMEVWREQGQRDFVLDKKDRRTSLKVNI
jgi:hypothetical protein